MRKTLKGTCATCMSVLIIKMTLPIVKGTIKLWSLQNCYQEVGIQQSMFEGCDWKKIIFVLCPQEFRLSETPVKYEFSQQDMLSWWERIV